MHMMRAKNKHYLISVHTCDGPVSPANLEFPLLALLQQKQWSIAASAASETATTRRRGEEDGGEHEPQPLGQRGLNHEDNAVH